LKGDAVNEGQDEGFKTIFEGMYEWNGDLSQYLSAFGLFLGLGMNALEI